MFQWFRELLEIKYEYRERRLRLEESRIESQRVCASCEVLRMALDRANHEKEQLLNKILNPPKEEEVKEAPEPQPIRPKQIPWRMRQQMLEEEDRAKAAILRQHKENMNISTKDLEAKLGIVNETR